MFLYIVNESDDEISCITLENRHHQHGRWQARIGRVAGNKDLYLGTFSKFTLNFCVVGGLVGLGNFFFSSCRALVKW